MGDKQPATDLSLICVGVLGCARIADKNALAISEVPGVRIVAVGSRSLEKAITFAEKHNISRSYGSYDEVINDSKVDAVYIPLPTTLHLQWVSIAAERGLHVLLEKPCAISSFELLKMIETCRKNKCFLMDGTMFMHHHRLSIVANDLKSAKFGSHGATQMISSFSFPGNSDFFHDNIRTQADADPLGCLGDLGWYCIRFALFAFGWDIPCRASAVVHSFAPGTHVPIDMNCSLTWSGSCTKNNQNNAMNIIPVRSCTFHVSFTHMGQQFVRLSGTNGSLTIEDFVQPRSVKETTWRIESEIMSTFDDKGNRETTSKEEILKTDVCRQEAEMWKSFRNCCNATNKGDYTCFWPEIALKTQLIMDALMESALSKYSPGAVAKVDPHGLLQKYQETQK